MVDILPDSRPVQRGKGSKYSTLFGCNMTPVFCANCHRPWGWVPEYGMTFAFVLCRDCEKIGDIAHFYKEPDHVFWERLAAEQTEAKRRDENYNDLDWLLKGLSDPTSALAKLAQEWDTKLRKEM